MDESHRLKSLPQDYDQKLFNQLYKETRALRNKLCFEIDSRKFGVDQYEVQSWFDVKFLHAFVKYYGDPRLKGYIINSLITFKSRVVKNSYQQKYSVHNSTDITEAYDLIADNEDFSEPIDDNSESLVLKIERYFRERLSPLAFMLWEIDFNPPPYILNKHHGKTKIPKCSDDLAMEYLGIDSGSLKTLKAEIREVMVLAKKYFALKAYKI